MRFTISNVRCFKEEQEVPIKQLTVLVGENSSGKTSLLSALHAVLIRQPLRGQNFNFNISPFAMGGYDNIASWDVKNGRMSNKFTLGWTSDGDNDADQQSTVFEFREKNRATTLKKISFFGSSCEGSIYTHHDRILLSAKINDKQYRFEWPSVREMGDMDLVDTAYLIAIMQDNIFERKRDKNDDDSPPKIRLINPTKISDDMLTQFLNLFVSFSRDLRSNVPVICLAPVRSKPLRTYEPFSLTFDPEGGHIPAKYSEFVSSSSKDIKTDVVNKLNKFGRQSGLFDNIEILSLGGKSSSPFQIIVSVGGVKINLADVGYGVSQVLPIIIESLLAEKASVSLLQQPEVHLHPRAQAALGTFFCGLVEKSNSSFIVETHSDYIIDRIRYEIAQGNIRKEKVQLLFFDKRGPYSKIYPIQVDDNGNIVNPPDTYREFFLDEEYRILSRTSKQANK